MTLAKMQIRLNVGVYSISKMTINHVWNKVSTDCVHAGNVNMFINRIEKYCVQV